MAGAELGRGPSEANQQKPRGPTAVPSFRPVFHLLGSEPHPSVATLALQQLEWLPGIPGRRRDLLHSGAQGHHPKREAN